MMEDKFLQQSLPHDLSSNKQHRPCTFHFRLTHVYVAAIIKVSAACVVVFYPQQANGPFSIGATSGVIHLASALDHNTNPTYNITVRARVSANS